jgi:hypothetical protein
LRCSLLPKEPLRRANVRFAIEFYASKFGPEVFKYTSGPERNLEEFKTNINNAFKRVSLLGVTTEKMILKCPIL